MLAPYAPPAPPPSRSRCLARFDDSAKGADVQQWIAAVRNWGFEKMAQASPSARKRPLSPHLQIWRWGPGMTASILNRVSGVGLSLVGLPLLLWWLAALASGPEAYATFAGWAWADVSQLNWSGGAAVASLLKLLVKVVLVGLTWALFQHTATGLRHYVLDIGAGYELDANNRWAIITLIAPLVLTALFWAYILAR
jgi:succinate dehydrogenase / fumarate reductase cytochrome b subunit